MNRSLTTPFGRRPVTPAQIRAQALADACPDAATVHKWAVFRDIATARRRLGLTDRALAILNALLTFHPETALAATGGDDLVVFPSNATLALRAHGIAESTLRRHLATLVEVGMIIRRDSPNGKRYARRGQGGAVVRAFGFDLAPLVVRAEEFARHAEAVRAEAGALRAARERVTLLRRDCAKLIAALGMGEGACAATAALEVRFTAILAASSRRPTGAGLETLADALADIAGEAGKLLLAREDRPKVSANAAGIERHCQSSNPETSLKEEVSGKTRDLASPRAWPGAGLTLDRDAFGLVLAACPDIAAFAPDGIRSWPDLTVAANLARAALGIGPATWHEAQAVMGSETAGATVAAILQRAEHIGNPGAYLGALVARRRAGAYHLGPVLRALLANREPTPTGAGSRHRRRAG